MLLVSADMKRQADYDAYHSGRCPAAVTHGRVSTQGMLYRSENAVMLMMATQSINLNQYVKTTHLRRSANDDAPESAALPVFSSSSCDDDVAMSITGRPHCVASAQVSE